MSWKKGILMASGIGGSVFGLRSLFSSGQADAPPSSPVDSLSDNLYQTGSTSSEDSNNWHQTSSTKSENSYFADGFIEPSDKKLASLSLTQSKNEQARESVDWDTYSKEVSYTAEEKAKNRRDAQRNYEKLNDYSFKIFMPCGWGTGWILDYKLPDKEGEYPTTWYIATNAHVAWRLRFSENTYDQKLPIYDGNTVSLRNKERNKEELHRVQTSKTDIRDNCWAVDKLGYMDLNLSQQDNGMTRNADVGAVTLGEMKEPKLIFSAFNFLDRSKNPTIPADHCVDFVVLEIEFTSPEIAKRTTNGFAEKYKEEGKAINLFGKPIERKYNTKRELWNSKDNYYLLAYPKGARNKWVYTKNWNEETTIAAHLAEDSSYADIDEVKDRYRGIMRADIVADKGLKWQGEIYKEIGHFWTLRWNPLGGGASGGLFVDAEGNAIAVTGNGALGSLIHWAIPLRSAGMTEKEAGFVSPKYDLILGADGQKFSYKSQIEKYNKKTWLSTKQGWNTRVV